MNWRQITRSISCGVFLLLFSTIAQAQKTAWRQASDAELASLLPARAQVEKEHIETEMRTASGIVNNRGHFIAGVVLLTAGYSAEGKYSHYLIVQSPVHIGGIALKPGEYVFGWTRAQGAFLQGCHRRACGYGKRPPHRRIKPRGEFAHLASRRQIADSDWAVRNSLRTGRRVISKISCVGSVLRLAEKQLRRLCLLTPARPLTVPHSLHCEPQPLQAV